MCQIDSFVDKYVVRLRALRSEEGGWYKQEKEREKKWLWRAELKK